MTPILMVPTTALWLTGRCELFLGWQVFLMALTSIKGTEGNTLLKEAVRSVEPQKSPSPQRALDPVLLMLSTLIGFAIIQLFSNAFLHFHI